MKLDLFRQWFLEAFLPVSTILKSLASVVLLGHDFHVYVSSVVCRFVDLSPC